MAWIAIHETVFGPKLRDLTKRIWCSQNEAVGILIRLWFWGLNNADEYGRLPHTEKEDLLEIVSVGLNMAYDGHLVVDSIIDAGWIDIENGEMYLHDWKDWQSIYYQSAKRKKKDVERKRAKKVADQDQSGESAEMVPEPEPEPKTPEKLEPPKTAVHHYEADFEEFWAHYPKKVGKKEAEKAYQARIRAGWSVHDLLVACKNYEHVCNKKHTEKVYIKHAKTFLSANEPFLDYIPNRGYRSDAMEDKNTPNYGGQFGGNNGTVNPEGNPFEEWGD